MWGRVGLCGIVRGWVGMWCGREDRARACEACGWAREARCGREDLGRQCVVCSEGGGWARAGVRVCVGVCVCGCVGVCGEGREGGEGGVGSYPSRPPTPSPPPSFHHDTMPRSRHPPRTHFVCRTPLSRSVWGHTPPRHSTTVWVVWDRVGRTESGVSGSCVDGLGCARGERLGTRTQCGSCGIVCVCVCVCVWVGGFGSARKRVWKRVWMMWSCVQKVEVEA